MFRGSLTAIVTPFRDGAIDYKAFDDLIEFQVAAGSHGIVVCGTTGESPTLSHDEHLTIIKRCIDGVKGRIPVIAGTGSNCTQTSVDMTQQAKDFGAEGALIVAPYYNKPTQEGLYAHYRTIAESVALPLIVYNIPGRSAVDITNETLARLAKIDNIIGVKDATGDTNRPRDLLEKAGPAFIQLSGEDATALALLKDGGHGCISVTANIAPAACAAMHDAWQDGDKDKAATIFKNLMPLHEALFVETNPAPVKYALSKMGLCTDELRLPLVTPQEKSRAIIDAALKACDIKPPSKNKAATDNKQVRHG